MSRGALLTGTAGGIVGSVTAGVGIIWSIVFMIFSVDLFNYIGYLQQSAISFSPYAFLNILIFPYPSSGALFNNFLLIVSMLLVVSSILLGVGFYGVYSAGGGAMGVVGLVSAIAGTVIGVLIIIMGVLTPTQRFVQIPIYLIFPPMWYIPYIWWPVPVPNYLVIWIGFIVLAVTFIVLGASSIAVRGTTANSSASVAAGILAIIGACFLFPFGLVMIVAVPWLAGVFTLIAFALITVAFMLWAVVFFSSREI
nr:hypothetical protein [Candidatus Freyarchaeota archaeon]